MTPFAAKLISIDDKPINELIVVLGWSSFGEAFLIGRADGTLEVHRVASVKLSMKIDIIPSNVIPLSRGHA